MRKTYVQTAPTDSESESMKEINQTLFQQRFLGGAETLRVLPSDQKHAIYQEINVNVMEKIKSQSLRGFTKWVGERCWFDRKLSPLYSLNPLGKLSHCAKTQLSESLSRNSRNPTQIHELRDLHFTLLQYLPRLTLRGAIWTFRRCMALIDVSVMTAELQIMQ